MSSVEANLEDARKSLLDMSLRNKLLNFKEYKRSTAEVVDEVPGEVYQRLVLDGDSMSFLPRSDHPEFEDLDEVPEAEAIRNDEDAWTCLLCDDPPESFRNRDAVLDHLEVDHEAILESAAADRTPDDVEDIWELPEIHEQGDDRHTDSDLQTPHTESDLQKRLYNIANRAEALIEDAGYNALYLALGFLEWTEAASQSDTHRAPLILVPLSIDREGARSSFEVAWNEGEISGNLSLELKLSDQGFDLPEFERPDDKSGIRDYLHEVEEAVTDYDQWRVAPDIHLGFFDFTKFIMYQDLDPDAWDEGSSPADHHLIRGLLDDETSLDEPPAFDEAAIDDELPPEEVHHVVDADPSQIAAIEDVKRGRDLVVQGPPGTGKSQTIVNIIAELFAEDKSVLFVSEKLAALNVVKDRLDSVKLGDFCLELHSDEASKSAFLEELERLANVDSYDPEVPDQPFRELDRRRDELNAYADALGTPFGDLEKTPYQLYGEQEEARSHFEAKGTDLPWVEIEDAKQVTPDEYQTARGELEALAARVRTVEPVDAHPWRDCSPGQLLPNDIRKVEQHLEDAQKELDRVTDAAEALASTAGVERPTTLAAVDEAVTAARLVRDGYQVAPDLLRDATWNTRPAEADQLIDSLDRIATLRADIGDRTNVAHVDADPAELLPEYRELHDRLTRIFKLRWYRLRSTLATLYDGEVPDDDEQIIADLEDLIELEETIEAVEAKRDVGRDLFGSLWAGAETDPADLEAFAEWIVDFRDALSTGAVRDEACDIVAEGGADEAVAAAIEDVQDAAADASTAVERVVDAVGADPETAFGGDPEDAAFEAIADSLSAYESATDELSEWAQFDHARRTVRETVAAPVVDLVENGDLDPDDILPCFTGAFADNLLNAAFEEREVLLQFDGAVHEDRIETFQELDRQVLELNRKRVHANLVDQLPTLMEGASRSSPAGTLLHEFGKERMHKPIRVLLREAGELIQQMKPCFMMSPRSVAKYLDPGTLDFDVVIFDEASQVTPEDALGTILRGDQVVLLGDSKQLPPTSFFDQVVDQREEDDQWEFNIGDVESILDLGRSVFPSKRLKWHYRSRHESLIAVSNQEFYDNELLVYPSPIQDDEDLGLRFNHLPDTVYDRGGSSVNREEARRVAQAAVDHYRETPHQSLGVGTFSQRQQEAVLEEVERLRQENPEVDQYFSRDREEHFFVKNLERIQGDERDVIFISVGYGRDQNGEFHHNFGPLNQQGGWRRLNVLITRARERCVVFSNFTADAIDPTKVSRRGPKSLKTFLDYAENRDLDAITEAGGDPDSPFERQVREFLREEGYDVHAQVGSAGFRIDLAIPDPENPGRYVLGIECDGASYHSSPTARARDRQRQAVLEDRGWTIYRVWSTDWFQSRERAQAELLDAVQRAIDRGAATVAGDRAERDGGSVASGAPGTETDPGSEPGPGDERDGDGETAADGPGVPSLDDLSSADATPSLEDLAEPYTKVTSIRKCKLGDHDASSTQRVVTKLVEEEGPIHKDFLSKRVVEHSDVTRRGSKVQETIDTAIRLAVRYNTIERRGDALYPPDGEITVRSRANVDADIETIPGVEIDEAIRTILATQGRTPKADLITQTARLFGFTRTGDRIRDRIGAQIDHLVMEQEIEKVGDKYAASDDEAA